MKHLVYSVYDKKALVYGQPIVVPHEQHVIRAVQQAANDVSLSVGQYPSDFALYAIGYFDDEHGSLCPYEKPRLIIEVLSLVKHEPEQLPLLAQEA